MKSLNNLANSWNVSISTKTKITFSEYPAIIEKFKSGRTLASIGKDYGVSRERIRQILSLYGISRLDGGHSTQSFINCQSKIDSNKKSLEAREEKCFEMYGCDLSFKKFMRGDGDYKDSPLMKYRNQKHCAEYRGIEWNFTLHEWWDVWQKSGHWDDRGFGNGKYVMARICDIGAYSADNIEIITHNENSSEARLMDKVYNRKNTTALNATKYELNGNLYTVKELSKIYKIKINTISARINSGLSVLDACTKPVRYWGR